MRRDGCPLPVEPGIPVGVIDMPMRVDKPGDRVRAQAIEGRGDSWSRDCKPGVDEKLAILAGEHGDVAAGTLQDGDVPTKPINLDLRLRGCLDHRGDNTRLLCEQTAL